MNGDPNKSEVAAAQAYFAFRTREAETKPSFDPSTLTRADILQIALNADEERLALEAKNKELEPKADAYDTFLDATGKYSVGAVAKMLGMGQNKLFRQLRNVGYSFPRATCTTRRISSTCTISRFCLIILSGLMERRVRAIRRMRSLVGLISSARSWGCRVLIHYPPHKLHKKCPS